MVSPTRGMGGGGRRGRKGNAQWYTYNGHDEGLVMDRVKSTYLTGWCSVGRSCSLEIFTQNHPSPPHCELQLLRVYFAQGVAV